jgi:hypothetical protein
MLRDEIRKGVKITGLFDLISRGADPFEGSYTLTKNLMSSNVITFSGNTSGKKGVRILPYKRGENASTLMTGVEVISGEFTGCIMGIYKEGGAVKVNHVDTEVDGHGQLLQKDAWETQKGSSGFQLYNEHSTKGELPKFFNGLSERKLQKYGTGMIIICVASPSDHAITRAIVYRDSSHDYKVLDVTTST